MEVRTRFAPSPTGTPDSVHLGFVIRALWNFAFAKRNQGKFILRIEDTDRRRSRQDTEETIKKILKDFGIIWDEGPDIGGPYGPYRQSERLDKYRKAAAELVDKGYAYYDFDAKVREKEEIKESYKTEGALIQQKMRSPARLLSSKEAKKRVSAGEPHVVRAKIPEDKVFRYQDIILNKSVGMLGRYVPDLIILKSDGFPTYHLAVVVDDIAMKISHVFRGQEWISTTPIHLHLYEGLGQKVPEIGHFTVILDPRTGKKFSKRDLTSMFGVNRWVDAGYLHEAILNYLMLLGWAPKDNREIFTLSEFIDSFDLAGVQKANPTFNPSKLDWFNEQYIRELDDATLASRLTQFTKVDEAEIFKVLHLIKDRLVKLSDFDQLSSFFFAPPVIEPTLFDKVETDAGIILGHAASVLEKDWGGAILEKKAREFCGENDIKVGDYFMILRIAITGKTTTPPLWEVMEILGKDETLSRLKNSLNLIS